MKSSTDGHASAAGRCRGLARRSRGRAKRQKVAETRGKSRVSWAERRSAPMRSARGKGSSTSISISVRCSRDGAISQENSRQRDSSERVLCCQEGREQVRPDSSVKHAHNHECRNRIEKLLTHEGAQRVESHFDRTRVRGETSTGGPVLSSGSTAVVTDAQTVKRHAEETAETDARTKKRQTAGTPVPQVHVGGSSSSGT